MYFGFGSMLGCSAVVGVEGVKAAVVGVVEAGIEIEECMDFEVVIDVNAGFVFGVEVCWVGSVWELSLRLAHMGYYTHSGVSECFQNEEMRYAVMLILSSVPHYSDSWRYKATGHME